MGELDQWMDENYLRQLWWSMGEEVSCRISIDKYGGSYAFIDFATHEGASKALATLNGSQIPQTNKIFKLNWSNRDGNGVPIVNNETKSALNSGSSGGLNTGGDYSIFVGDLGADVDDNVLMAAFQSRYGSIRSAKVMIDPVTGYSRGFGFIRFFDENDQQRSLEEMQGVYVGSRPLRVSVARPRAKFDVGLSPHTPESEITTVFVGGLNNTITEEELCAYFGTYGDILAVKIIPNKNIAFIQYEKRISAEQAIAELNGSHLGGAKLRLSFGRTQLNTVQSMPVYQPQPPPAPVQLPPVDLVEPTRSINYFNRFEKVDKVFLNEDDNETLNGSATIVFRKIPREISRLITRHKVDGATVTVEFINDASTEQFYYSSNRRANKSVKFFAKTLSFGSLIAPKKFVSEWTTSQDIRYILQYTQRRVHIFFSHLGAEYKMEYKFKDVYGDMHFERQNDMTTLTIPLRYPGIFWKRNNNSVTEKSRSISVGYSWERVTLIPLEKSTELVTKLTKPLTPISRTDVVNIAYWRVLRLIFRPYPKFAAEFERNLKEAASFNLVPEDLRSHRPPMEVIPASTLPKPLGHVERSGLNLSFDVLYLLESIISYHYVNQYNLTDIFYNQLKQLEPDISCGLLNYIALSKKIVYDPALEFNRIWDKKGMKVKDQRSIPSHCAMLRKVIITPSHMYIQPPSLETTNRVVRHYREYSDRFIRVQFMDEGFNRVGPSLDQKTKEVVYSRIYQILKRGIQIGDRRYEFLAFSSSQLREQGCWFFAPTADLTPDMIRSWMGVFSHEKVVAKHAVRMGQCFSSTRPVYILREDQVAYIEDIKRNGYTFSDGVGKISPALAEEVAIQMDLRTVPSAFQFRLGGAKGVLTVDKSLADEVVKVQLRPSQIKFESKHLTLEVIRTSTFINGYLNRQVITLLSALGVKDEVFMELMDSMLLDINKMLEKPSEAVRVLQSNADSVGTVKSMVSLIQAGFLERKDPYITNLLSLFRINVLKDLKKKAKIIVPNGAYLLGVMDETNTLEEGEVFVQIYNNTNNNAHKEIITGEVVVFRNPCFHPGDVRIVKAVDNPDLHHLIDVVVFSSKGFRDIPSMCSGGDLDGDDYT
ncbi:RNA dependent RNA polymerase-domain-containing protein [Helicostylum pulchrum]|nr:RNA dependent RNA polymerase-domain-containing protein [Helicostylum pulchrum]